MRRFNLAPDGGAFAGVRAVALTGVLATAAVVAAGLPAEANACLIDTDNSANATAGVDTTAGADGDGANPDRLACGTDAATPGQFGTAVGARAVASGATDSSAFGADSIASGNEATAIGAETQATANNATAVGGDADATNLNSTALGQNAQATGASSTAVGQNAEATGTSATAVGREAEATGTGSTSLGQVARATNLGSTAVGQNALATGANSSALGKDARAVATGSTAVGFAAEATADRALAAGDAAQATAANSTAIGTNANAAFTNSTAIGTGATTTRANQIVLGTAAETYTMPGLTSAASAAAQVGPLQVVTTDAAGNLASDGGAIFAGLAGLRRDVDTNRDGVAMAMALQAPYVPPDQSFALNSSFGFFDGASAFSLSGGWRVDQNVQFDAGLAYGFDSNEVGGRVGVTFAW